LYKAAQVPGRRHDHARTTTVKNLTSAGRRGTGENNSEMIITAGLNKSRLR
jgi:hypothetical protein